MDKRSPTAFSGRREANKQATRAAVLEAAQGLFAQQGYENTTVRAIADAAGVTERTFYRYFEGKEGLLIEEAIAWIEHVGDAVRARPIGEAPFLAVQCAMTSILRETSVRASKGSLAHLLELPRPLELLRGLSPRLLRRLETAIAVALRDRRGDLEADYDDQVLARVATIALRSAVIRHRELLATSEDSPGLPMLLEEAFATVARVTRLRPSSTSSRSFADPPDTA